MLIDFIRLVFQGKYRTLSKDLNPYTLLPSLYFIILHIVH